MQNFDVHVGNDPDYTKNPKCPGGPFMVVGDPKSYTAGSGLNAGMTGNMWNYGVEIWCNLEG